MAQFRDEVEALADALVFGICDVDRVIAWADAQILARDSPPIQLCEVSLAGALGPLDVAGLLRQLPGTPIRATASQLLSLFAAALKRDRNRAYGIAKALDKMALADRIEDADLRQVGCWAWDELDLIEAGLIVGSWDDDVRRMADALDRAVAEATITWSVEISVPDRP